MSAGPKQAKPLSEVSECSSRVEESKVPVCRYFLQGKCRFGDKCKNSHGDSQPKKQLAAAKDDVELLKGAQAVASKSSKGKMKDDVQKDESQKKVPMRTSDSVISRILWDPDLPSEEFKVGYLDRFVGIVEKPFSSFSWEDLATVGNNVLAVPKHRIQYFKFRDEIVWDKRSQMDNFFGSRGGRTIQDIVAEQQQSTGSAKDSDSEEAHDESKTNDEKLIDVDIEEDVLEGEGNTNHVHSDRNRPSHFVCFHITNQEVKENVAKVQSHMTTLTPQLAEGCLPVTALHVTLCMVRLENDHQISIAQEVMKNARLQFIHTLPRCLQLSFTGVSNFRERLVYVKVAPCPALDRFVFFLMDRFQEAGLHTPGNHEIYTPHMTVAKLSRPMQRELHTGVISPASYQPFLDMNVGSSRIENLSLCSMTAPKQTDGFYFRLSEINNSLSGLPAHFLSLLLKRVDFFYTSGVVTESERDELSRLVQAASQQGGMQEFDSAIEEIIRLGQEESMCSSNIEASQVPVVITLRGVPGSGKSYLATHCSEYLLSSAKVAICSADSFFMASGVYNFSTQLLPVAHTQCLELFLQALDEGKGLIVVDNTNSKMWEYRIYRYLSSILGCKFYVLEVPCPSVRTLESFRSRNQHNIDPNVALKIFQRWEVDDRAFLVPPSLAYPRMVPTSLPQYSLVSLCLPDGQEVERALHGITAIKAVYTAVFLTTESQWKLLTTLIPTHPRINGKHVTLLFEPGKQSCLAANIGRKVTVHVMGSVDSGKLQVATVELPHDVVSQNPHPHITVSTEEDVPSKLANEILQRQTVKPLPQPLELDGVIGVMVRETNVLDEIMTSKEKYSQGKADIGIQQTFAVKSETTFEVHVLPKLATGPDDIEADTNIHICTGIQKITNLYIFDFDGTLFNTPDPQKGRRLYENYTGKKWRRKGWLSWPESLLSPMKTGPGPALPIYREHISQAGSLTVVLTGRIERTKTGVQQVLENFKVYPEQLIMKPDAIDELTPAFKTRVVKQLLEKYPNVTSIKFWDDLPGNLAAMHSLSKSYKHIHFEIIDATKMLPTAAAKKMAIQAPLGSARSQLESTSSFLESYLASCGYFPNITFKAAANFGTRFIAEQFCKILGYSGDPLHLVYHFGSFPLGRKGDVDFCLVCPPNFTPTDCLEQLWRQLGDCGINYLHKGYSTRCPRLKVMLEFPSCPPIDYDIVFASISDAAFFSTLQTVQLPAPQVLSLIKPEDTASKTAFTGAILLHKLLKQIDGVIPKSQFGAIVEMIVQVFCAQRQKGNAYHCIRTFHIVHLLAEFIKTCESSLKQTNCDLLFKEFVAYAAKVPDDQLKKLFGEYVPFVFIPKVREVFELAAQVTAHDEDTSLVCYEKLMDRSTPYPPEGYTTVEVNLSGSNTVALWKLHVIVEARFPSYIRQLISSGLDVHPDGNTQNERRFVFAVPHTKSTKHTLQQVLRPFWNEIAEFRKEEGVNINLNFGQASSRNLASENFDKADLKHTLPPPIIDAIMEFVTDPVRTEMRVSSQLKPFERMRVYETCEQLSLNHTTTASGKEKHIIIKKK